MGSLLDILPIVTILTMGLGVWWVIGRFQSLEYRKTELFNICLMLGTFILIFPLTLIGIQPSGILSLNIGEDTLNIIDFRGYCMIYFLLGLILSIIGCYYLLSKILSQLADQELDLNTIKDYRLGLISFLLIDYLILELILPLRGFDALYYYLPEAEVFYQAGRITEVNYLSFLPVVKSPLNVLLYVYSYYVTGDLSIQLLPFIFLLGIVFLIYDFSIELFNNRNIGLIAAIFTLTLPFTYWLMNYWAFYQDLYLCYFFSITCYFSLKWYKNPPDISLGLFMGIGIISSLLTKINAWVLPIILVLWFPTGSRGKKIRIAFLPILGVFLCTQAATRTFIGATLPIIISLGAAGYFIIKENLSDKPNRPIIRFITIGVSMAIGSFWLMSRMSLSSSVWEEIYDLYFNLSESVKWIYNQPQDPLLHTLEKVHRVNFVSAAGILFLGTCFVLPWIIPKIFALKDFHPITSPLIWLLVFFGIWAAYYLDGSIRYLSPIIIPMILIISWGFHQLTRKINSKALKEFIVILFAFLGCSNFYYLIPLNSLKISDQTQEIIGLSYNQAALDYYSFSGLHFYFELFVTIGIGIIILVYITRNSMMLPIWFRNQTNILWLRRLLLVGTIMIPLVVQSYLLLDTQGDFKQFHAIHEYEYRPEYQELVEVIQQQNQPLTAILTVRTPGLQFFTKQPVIDIYYQNYLFKNDPFFNRSSGTYNNMTELLTILQSPFNYIGETGFSFNFIVSIGFIVVPAPGNIYFDVYNTTIMSRSYFFQSLENYPLFSILIENSDFILFEVDLKRL